MQRVRHRPDVVVHRRRHRLDELAPGTRGRAQREVPAHQVGVRLVGDHFDLAVANLDVEILVVDADDEIGREEAANHLEHSVFVDPFRPAHDPVGVEFGQRGIACHPFALFISKAMDGTAAAP